MTEVTVSVEINRPPDQVFAYIADMANNPSWQKGMRECRWTSEPPLRLGSTYDQVARFLGRDIVNSFEVTEFVAGETIRIQSTAGAMPLDITRSVEPVGVTSRVSAAVKGDPPFPMKLFGPLLNMMVRRSIEADYRRLKDVLEAEG